MRLNIHRMYADESTVARMPNANIAVLSGSMSTVAVCKTPLNIIHSAIKPLVGGMPMMVRAPIIAMTAV